MDLRDAAAYHQLVLNSEGRSVRTQQQYLFYERRFLDYLALRGIDPGLEALSETNVRQALLWYRSQPDHRRSRGGEVAARAFVDILKRWARLLEEHDIFADSPLRKLKRVRIAKHTRVPFAPAEVNALWAACLRTQNPRRDEALFLLLLDTGMRIGEACALRLDDLHLAQRQVIVFGKGRRERVVPIGDPAKRDGGRSIRALRAYLDYRQTRGRADEYVFLARDGYRLTAEGGNDVFKRLGRMAGVDNVFPHRLRHTFCTWYLTVYPGDELGLRRIVGHLSREVLADYVHFAQTTIAERAGRASLAESWLGERAPATNGHLAWGGTNPLSGVYPSRPAVPLIERDVGDPGRSRSAPPRPGKASERRSGGESAWAPRRA